MAFLIGGANSAAAAGGYDVDNSCRFNDGDSPSLSKTMVAGSTDFAKKFTISVWFKLGTTSGARPICSFGSGTGNAIDLLIDTNSKATFESWDGSVNPKLATNRLLRDHSAWYNIVIAVDTTQATDTNRMKMYINGTQETSFASSTYAAENYAFPNIASTSDTMKIGNGGQYNSNYFDGYIAEFCYCDGQVLAPTSFGEFDEDSPTIWKPIDVSELTFGNAGTYCDFEDSGNLGDDESGNTNDLTENNIVAADQAFDTPTNNFSTMNPLDNYYQGFTYSEGNCKIVTQASSIYTFASSTLAASSGKWYAECKLAASGGYCDIGIADGVSSGTVDSLGGDANEFAKHDFTGNVTAQGSGVANGSALSVGNICGIYLDLDNNKLYFSINGSLQNSTGLSISASSATTNGYYLFGGGDEDGGSAVTLEWNFGGCSAFAISSAVNDGDYGAFEYSTTITGDGASKTFKALCTKNLAEYG